MIGNRPSTAAKPLGNFTLCLQRTLIGQHSHCYALTTIPAGHVVSYEEVAAAVDRPGASRAVGRAIASNPLGYLVPCHRVIHKTGEIGGYRWGTPRKRAILAFEAARKGLDSAP